MMLGHDNGEPAREKLLVRAGELGCFENPEERTDKQLADAIAAEKASAAWEKRWESLPTLEAQRDAIRRLAEQFAVVAPDGVCKQCGERCWRDQNQCPRCFYIERAGYG